MSFKGTFQPNPIYDYLINNWRSLNYEINTYSSWSTFLASVTRRSNPIFTQVLTLLRTHIPSALPLTHCTYGGRSSSFLWGGWVAPFFPSLPWLLWALWSHVWPWSSTQSGCLGSGGLSHHPDCVGLGVSHVLPVLPARHDIHSEVPSSRACCYSRVSQPPLLLFIPLS